ncbi:hypothetical protein ACFY19_20840 [Streptosporangium saharense]|uniref:hypothetical protein n=1 Tax=Streptosporangium saharense TaxID=1706840 RepID=UPI0036CDC3DB
MPRRPAPAAGGEWASIRLSGPPALVAELAEFLRDHLDVTHPSPAPSGEGEARWYGLVRPPSYSAPQPPVRGVPREVPAVLIAGVDGPLLMVRGRDRDALHQAAAEYADAHGLVLLDPPGTVPAELIREVSYCLPHCGCGRDTAHYMPTAAAVTGAFRGGFFAVSPAAVERAAS